MSTTTGPSREAIRRELLREGQVFYVHNRVQDIEHVAAQVRELVPGARVAIAHGQMDESRLERVVLDFADREFDVLVCTTIIESGLDMPTVNTMVVDRADLLGLAQLYQLRGRVGRRGSRAYAYLLHPQDRVLSEEAYERLKAIGEFTDLGSGFKLAMRDLEIRGAGNLLGGAQSGHIAAVGFDLYCELVTEAVGELKGEPKVEEAEVVIDIPVDAHLPREYVSRDDVRMEAYRRLAAVTTQEDVDDVRTEWLDRYGPLPPAAEALLSVARLRAEAVRVGATNVSVQKGVARIDGLTLRESQKVRLRRLAPRATAKEDGEVAIPLTVTPDEVSDHLLALLRELIPRGLRGPRARMTRVAAGRVPSSVKRPLVLLAATLVAALLLSACGSAGDPDAATVGKTGISRSQLDDELNIIADNKELAKELSKQNPPLEVRPTPGSISPAITTGWLTSLVNQVFVDRVFNAEEPQDHGAEQDRMRRPPPRPSS